MIYLQTFDSISTIWVYGIDTFVAKPVEEIPLPNGSAYTIRNLKHLNLGMALTDEEATCAKLSKTLEKHYHYATSF